MKELTFTDFQDYKMKVKQLEEEKFWFKAKADRLEQEQEGSFYLDLEV